MPNLNTIVGKFGSGKTSTAVDMMLAHMSKGGVVASNINLRSEPFISNIYQCAQAGFVHALRKLYNWEYREGQFIYLPDTELISITALTGKRRMIPKAARFWEHIPAGKPDLHVLVFIDEAHKVWPKDSYSFMPTGDTDIISVMRHLNVELFWMTQHQEHVWVDMRRLNEDWYFVNNLKKGGMGICSRFPLALRPIAQLIALLLGLILRPIIGRCPDVIRIRKFRSQEESKEFLYAGYPKYQRYSPLVLQSYDSPKAVSMIQMDSEASNDFRSGVPVVKPPSKFKKMAPSLLFGSAFLAVCVSFSFGRSSRPAVVPVPVSAPASNAVISPVSVAPVLRSREKALLYKWFSVVGDRASVCLDSGEVVRSGELLPDSASALVTVSDDRLLLADGSIRRLVKVTSNAPPVVASSVVSSVASGFGLHAKPF